MAGRGRPHEALWAKSPARPEEPKPAPASRCSGKGLQEKKPRAEEEKPKKREQKQAKRTDEKPSVLPAKTKEEKCIKTKISTSAAGKMTSPEHTTQEKPKTREQKQAKCTDEKPSVLPARTKEEMCIKTKISTSAAGKTTSPEHTTQEKPKTREQKQAKCTDEKPSVLPARTGEKYIKTKISTTAAGKTTSPEHRTEEKPKTKEQKTIKPTTKPPARQASVGEKSDVDNILQTTLDNLKIRTMQRAEAACVINGIMKAIMDHLKLNSHTDCFKEMKQLRTGSYYENLKISNPDEFDVMLTIPIDRVDIKPFGDDGAFYSVALKRGKSPLDRFMKEDNTIVASEMLKNFREEVKKCVKTMKNVELEKKKRGCPAVTLWITEASSVPISLDVVLGLEVRTSWPDITKEGFQIEGWLGKKVKQEFKRKPYYLVPKYEGKGTLQRNGVLAKDAWRISFSHVEKDMLKSHGSEKTCCEVGSTHCCRKACLKLLKHLLHLLKEQNPLFSKFCSYHAKTTLFHACCSRTKDSDWQASRLSHCFLSLLDDFEGHLREGKLSNFFIPTQNLLSNPCSKSCTSLAQRIKEERNNGFPIFRK